jgi:4-alpha-glucanotransferase
MKRKAGIVLHPTSLPGGAGIGDLGPEAYRFADFLAGAGIEVWQVLPLGPTGYGDSPYQALSAFAGNPMLISLEALVADGLLSRDDLVDLPEFPEVHVDFSAASHAKLPLLKKAAENFVSHGHQGIRDEFSAFCWNQRQWLDDYALFRAAKDAHDGVQWTRWARDIAVREQGAVERWTAEVAEEIETRKLWQFLFFRQWNGLKRYCNERDVELMGDVPIFVAHDSAEVWAHREWFDLGDLGQANAVAGVPPDYFSETGQLWGNPLYRWDVMAQDGYTWWVDRMKAALELVDLIRLDHFRGFEAYWRVSANETTAINGEWVKGPGAQFFESLQESLGELPLIAEDLGVITPEVEELRDTFGYPGMAILQFAFGSDSQSSDFIPHNVKRNVAFYTGTHDNDTVVGWWSTEDEGDSTRSMEEVNREREFAKRYLNTSGQEIHWDFIRAVIASVGRLAIIPAQDLLGLGSEARMNLPGSPSGNWTWRVEAGALNEEIRERLRELLVLYGRTPSR